MRAFYQGVALQTRLTAPPLPKSAISAFGPEAEKLAKAAQDRFTQASILAGGGRDPALVVDQAFRQLHLFTGVENATSSPLLTFMLRLDMLAKRAAWEELQAAWKAEVMTFCQTTTTGRYPVVRGAGILYAT